MSSFRWTSGWARASIAALAFVNITGDPAQKLLSDGVSQELINATDLDPAADTVLCTNPGARHSAYVVVKYQGGAITQKCVGFEASRISGEDLMTQSGLAYETREFAAGKAVCSIGGEPPHVTTCFPRGSHWWFLFVSRQGGSWTFSDSGFTRLMLEDGDALGWRRGNPSDPPPLPTRPHPT